MLIVDVDDCSHQLRLACNFAIHALYKAQLYFQVIQVTIIFSQFYTADRCDDVTADFPVCKSGGVSSVIVVDDVHDYNLFRVVNCGGTPHRLAANKWVPCLGDLTDTTKSFSRA